MKSLWSAKDGAASTTATWFKAAADEAAAKLRQQKDVLLATAKTSILAGDDPGDPMLPSIKEPPKADQQFLRLPIESAKKLRFYDKAELDNIISAHNTEKDALYRTCSALQHLLKKERNVTDAWIDEEVQGLLSEKDCLQAYDDAVNATLLVAAQGEMHRLKAADKALQSDLASLQRANEELRASLAQARSAAPPEPKLHGPEEARRRASTGALRQRTEVQLEVEPGWGDDEHVVVRILAEGTPAEEGGSGEPAGTPAALDSAAAMELQVELQGVQANLDAERQRTAALVGKLARLEEEKRTLIDDLSSARQLEQGGGEPGAQQQRIEELQRRLAAAEEAAAAAAEESNTTAQLLRQQEEDSEKKLAELRAKVSQAGAQQSEMLRRAQDICMEAEERAEAAEHKTSKAEGRVTQIESDLRECKGRVRELEKEVKKAEKAAEKAAARAEAAENAMTDANMKGHAEAQAGASVRSALAAARRASEEKEAELRRQMAAKEAEAEEELSRLRERCSELEEEAASLTAQLSKANAEAESWERRLREADERESSLMSDLREAEAVVAERDVLAVRVNALEDKLSESRNERGQIEDYKQVARELENSRQRAEEELMATARIVTSLEGRLRSSNLEAEQARLAVEEAEQRVIELERRMEDEVKARMLACGKDRAKWPTEARGEVERLELKAEAVQGMLSTLEEQLESETKARMSDTRHTAMLRRRVSELEAAAIQQEREAGDRVRALERDLRLAKDEAEECRRIVSELEEERLALQEKMAPRVADDNGMFRNRGGGSLYGASDEQMATNGNGAGGGGDSVRPEIKGVDIVYLKNVVLKFIEASVRHDLVQRDALLPAIATLVQATPQEFRALMNTAAGAAEEQGSWYSMLGGSSMFKS